ncbi:MAG: sulfotransferase [Sulfuricaulis sp.]|uniref:tetratricopeptide repeat-containing sulfotransferase family protein n=1 Tax=Sulfuricaulis sp. TaxID=2003553 RepID=UPI003C4C9A90
MKKVTQAEAVTLPAVFAEAKAAFSQGRNTDAIRLARAATREAPLSAECMTFLGCMLGESGQTSEAMTVLERAAAMAPDKPEPWRQMGRVLSQFAKGGNRAQAERYFCKAATLAPDQEIYQTSYGECLVTLGRYDKAIEVFQRSLALDPESPLAIGGLAAALERSGQFERARDILRPLLDRGNRHPQLVIAFAAVARHTGEETPALELIEEALNESPPVNGRIGLHFAAGDLLDRMKRYDQAFRHYEQANALSGYVYDPVVAERELQRLISFFSAQAQARRPRASNRSELPVFIVGMTRSGTTLVEQILASHPEVRAGGELEVIPGIISDLPRLMGDPAPFPECLGALTRRNIEQPARRYIAALAEIGQGATRVTDKLPHNFLSLGLIDLLLPSARVIHCVRDPVDTCLSNYFKRMSANHPYTANLEHLGHYYRVYQRLMTHWRSVLRIRMHEVRYEALVSEPETEIRRLLDFCGLPWDQRCLSFHENRRSVATPSYDQVRRPIYNQSVQRWRHYEAHLGPLLRALGL